MELKKKSEEFSDTKQVPLSAVNDLVRAANSAVLLPNIAKFNGETSPAEAKEWLRTIKAQATIAQWVDKQKLETARRLLTDTGKAWYLLNADEIETWNDFCKLFFDNFVGEEDSVIDKWERFQSHVQKEKESPREYVLDKLRLVKDVNASVRESKASVCASL